MVRKKKGHKIKHLAPLPHPFIPQHNFTLLLSPLPSPSLNNRGQMGISSPLWERETAAPFSSYVSQPGSSMGCSNVWPLRGLWTTLGNIHSLLCGVLHGLQCHSTCPSMVRHGLQGNLCYTAWSISSSSFFDLGVHWSIFQTCLLHSSLLVQLFALP